MKRGKLIVGHVPREILFEVRGDGLRVKSQGEESEGMDWKCRVYWFVAKQRCFKKLRQLCCSLQTNQIYAHFNLFVVVCLFVFFTGFLYFARLVCIPKK